MDKTELIKEVKEVTNIDFLINFMKQEIEMWINYKKNKNTDYLFMVAFSKNRDVYFYREDGIITIIDESVGHNILKNFFPIIDESVNGNILFNNAHIYLEEGYRIIYYKADAFEQCRIYLKDDSMYIITLWRKEK